ncbi:MAG: bifunctional glutamate N-acetyltransferase/amino-acid acetyltransferase ArgJ [Deltaproteobacteria bacterium]|nr:bifunctional glutamate N-acetyltransferase/amino-acid acetyltransferase ArgJ [Deltaproteobacteria bacterium]
MSENIKICPGYKFVGVASGLKKAAGALDLALLLSDTPAVAAAVFTKNRFPAAPVIYGRKLLAAGRDLRAVLINSGNANACTGRQGEVDVVTVAEFLAAALQLDPQEVFISSTGVIGEPFPVTRVLRGIESLLAELEQQVAVSAALTRAARAIMTTDKAPKVIGIEVETSQGTVTLTGLAKGAGMIHPDMATMLAYLLTDAKIDREIWQAMLQRVVSQSFNRISVDGDMSTNDTVLALANGVSGCSLTNPVDLDLFETALLQVANALARMIVKDGEGATKVVEITVTGAANLADAEKICRTVANSALVKTAFFGQDANWGRIIAAVGYAGVELDSSLVNIDFDQVRVVSGGVRDPRYREEAGAAVLRQAEFSVKIDLQSGEDEFTLLTSDLTHEYVSINADYRS